MKVSLPFPAKILWPNGRTRSTGWKAAETAKHRGWAKAAALAEKRPTGLTAPIPVHVTVCPQSKGQLPDSDGCVSACKAYFDGLADALSINDRDFAAPTVAFGPREARIEITLGPIQNGDQP